MRHKNENGYSLVGVLLIFTIATIAGISLVSITINSLKTSTKERDNQAVYYIAEAGLNYFTEEVEKTVELAYKSVEEDIDNLLSGQSGQDENQICTNLQDKFQERIIDNLQDLEENETYASFEKSNDETPYANLSYEVLEGNKILLASNGHIGGEERKVTQEILLPEMNIDCEITEGVEGGAELPPLAVLTNGEMKLTNGSILGSIGTHSTERNAIQASGGGERVTEQIYVPEIEGNNENELCKRIPIKEYKSYSIKKPTWEDPVPCPTTVETNWEIPSLPPFPDIPNYECLNDGYNGLVKNCNASVNWESAKKILKLDKDAYFKEILVSSNYSFKFDVNGQDREIVVDNLNILSGHIEIQGEGKLTVYVKDKFTIGAGSTFNQGGKSKNLNIFYKGSAPVTMSGDEKVYGSLYAEKANLNLDGSGGFYGNIFTGGTSVTLNGDANAVSQLIFAPNAHVNLGGSGKVKGQIISKEFTVSGGGAVEFVDCIINPESSQCNDYVKGGPISAENLQYESQENNPSQPGLPSQPGEINVEFNGFELETGKIKEVSN